MENKEEKEEKEDLDKYLPSEIISKLFGMSIEELNSPYASALLKNLQGRCPDIFTKFRSFVYAVNNADRHEKGLHLKWESLMKEKEEKPKRRYDKSTQNTIDTLKELKENPEDD